VKNQQEAAARRALPAGHVITKRTRADHKTTTDSESWLVDAGNLKFEDKKAAGAVWKSVNRALGENRKSVLTVVPNVGFIASGELAKKSKDKT
jgi:hypothetical protein